MRSAHLKAWTGANTHTCNQLCNWLQGNKPGLRIQTSLITCSPPTCGCNKACCLLCRILWNYRKALLCWDKFKFKVFEQKFANGFISALLILETLFLLFFGFCFELFWAFVTFLKIWGLCGYCIWLWANRPPGSDLRAKELGVPWAFRGGCGVSGLADRSAVSVLPVTSFL